MSDDLDPLRELRPDRAEYAEPNDPWALAREKERLMSIIEPETTPAKGQHMPSIYPRLAYNDERAALDYLTRVFGFEEIREARLEHGGHMLAWLRVGSGVVMIGHANTDVHLIHSPASLHNTTVQMMVYVHDIDEHYAHAVASGALVTMDLRDAFYGDRVYEATDPEGHRWHFGERFADIEARGGTVEPEAGP